MDRLYAPGRDVSNEGRGRPGRARSAEEVVDGEREVGQSADGGGLATVEDANLPVPIGAGALIMSSTKEDSDGRAHSGRFPVGKHPAAPFPAPE